MVIPSPALQACFVYAQRQHLVKMSEDMVVHKGGCHCQNVRFEVKAASTLTVIDCNCSVCVKKQNKHFIVPLSHFKMVKGHDCLKTYTFGTHEAKHFFCQKCGVQSFYIPRSNPDGYGIAIHCLDEGTVKKIKFQKFDGKNFEAAIKKNPQIKAYSKEK